jgi:hypothetical protein
MYGLHHRQAILANHWLLYCCAEIAGSLNGSIVGGHVGYLGVLMETFNGLCEVFCFGLVGEDTITPVMIHGGSEVYQPSVPWVSHNLRCMGFSCRLILVPGGAISVLLKSKVPSNIVYTNTLRLLHDRHRRLSVRVACVMSQSHRCIVKQVSVLHSNPGTK